MKITIVTVAYNSENTIANTISSVASQKHKNIEHLIIDGQSTDKTLKIVEAYQHSKLVFRSEPDEGIYDAMNKGVKCASGDIIGILNSDDFYVNSNVLNEVVEAFESDDSLEVVIGDVDFVKFSNLRNPIRMYRSSGFKLWMFRFGFMPPHPAIFIRKKAYKRVGFYSLNYKIAADFDFLLRLMLIDGARYKLTSKHWVRMINGGVSTSGISSKIIITREINKSLNENGFYSCIAMLLFRFPIKFIWQILL
jgi:glycosyltransferase involved in cell wall biosynthesis